MGKTEINFNDILAEAKAIYDIAILEDNSQINRMTTIEFWEKYKPLVPAHQWVDIHKILRRVDLILSLQASVCMLNSDINNLKKLGL